MILIYTKKTLLWCRFMSFFAVSMFILTGMAWGGGREVDLFSQPPEVTVSGAGEGDLTGQSVAFGDINGDGVKDLLIGAYGADGPGGKRPGAGRIYVLYGKSSLPGGIDLASEADVVIYGVSAGDHIGYSLSSADVDGDGKDDILSSAPLAARSLSKKNTGSVIVFYGKDSLTGEVDLHLSPGDTTFIYGADINDYIGCSITTGDINGDGFLDIMIGTRYGDGPNGSRANAGEVYILYGRGQQKLPSFWDLAVTPPDFTLYGLKWGDECGCSIASGDLNGNGNDDLVMGAIMGDGPDGTRYNAGEVYIIYGRDDLLGSWDLRDPGADVTIYGIDGGVTQDFYGDLLGISSSVGDFNGDGIDDLLVGAPLADGPDNGRTDSGEVYLIFGKSALPPVWDLSISPPDVIIYGKDPGDQMSSNTISVPRENAIEIVNGFSSAMGDVNGDGFSDVLVAGPLANGPANLRTEGGELYIIYGKDAVPSERDLKITPPDFTYYGMGSGDRMGVSLGAGDSNDDGKDDILIGVPMADGPSNSRDNSGEAYLLLGRPLSDAGEDQIVFEGNDVILDGSASTDPNGHSLSFNWLQTAGASVQLSSNASVMPEFTAPLVSSSADTAELIFRLVVNDGVYSSAADFVKVTVSNVNQPPELDPIGSKNVNEGSSLNFTITGSDPDGNALKYSYTGLPVGATVNPTTLLFNWTPGYTQSGTHFITFTVTDGNLSDQEIVEITVNNINQAPVLNTIGATGVNEGDNLNFTISGSDPDGDTLTYSATGLPTGATFNASTRVFDWTPSYTQSGTYNVTFDVTDGSLTDNEVVTITVNNIVAITVSDGDLGDSEDVSITVNDVAPETGDMSYEEERIACNIDTVIDLDNEIAALTGSRIDGYDLMVLLRAMGSIQGGPGWWKSADINKDGKVDENDLAILLSHFGENL